MKEKSQLPEWLPETVVLEVQTPSVKGAADLPEFLGDIARDLLISARLEGYWRGPAGRRLGEKPVLIWSLAECIEVALTGENIAEGRFSLGNRPQEMLRPRSERKAEARKVAKLAEKFADLVEESRFDIATGSLFAMGRDSDADPEWRLDGPDLSEFLGAVSRYAKRVVEKIDDEPMFKRVKAGGQDANFLQSVLYSFHEQMLCLSRNGSEKASAQVVAFLLKQEVDPGAVRDNARHRR